MVTEERLVDLSLSEEHALIRTTARRLAEAELLPLAPSCDREAIFPEHQIKKLGDNGFLAMLAPHEFGGSEAGAVAYALAMTEVARCCGSTAVTMAVTNMVCDAICAFGTEAQKKKYVPRLASGEFLAGSFSLSEPGAGSDAASLTSVAESVEGGYRLRGNKCWVTSGDRAGVILLMAKTDEAAGARGISAFLVEPDTPGLTISGPEDKMGLRGSSTVSLHMDGLRVSSEQRLGPEGAGFRIAMRALDGGRIGVAAQAIGLSTACLEASAGYAQERQQFGKPLSHFQAIQWKLADIATELDAARLMVLRAAWLKEHEKPFSQRAAMAKLFATEAANRAALEAVQIHGGYGYTSEFPVERFLRDLRVTTIYEGTSEIQRWVISRSVLAEGA